jgi:hypothetical protein
MNWKTKFYTGLYTYIVHNLQCIQVQYNLQLRLLDRVVSSTHLNDAFKIIEDLNLRLYVLRPCLMLKPSISYVVMRLKLCWSTPFLE